MALRAVRVINKICDFSDKIELLASLRRRIRYFTDAIVSQLINNVANAKNNMLSREAEAIYDNHIGKSIS